MAAATGASLVIPEVANPFGICKAIEEHSPSAFAGVPSLFTYLLQGVSPFRQSDLSSLRLLTNTGGTIPKPVLRELQELVPDANIVLNYGLTESYRSSFLSPDLVRERPDSIGKAIPGVDIAIVDENGDRAPPGEIGEIVHRGDFIFLEYWNDPEATLRVRRPDPFEPSSRKHSLFTGDLGRMDNEGFLYFEGRRDRQLKVMGVRVSPEEIEGIFHTSGLLSEVAIFGVAHEMLGREVCAAIVPAVSGENRALRGKLIRFAREAMTQNMAPRRFLFLESLPKTATGKTDYLALAGLLRDSENL